MDKDNFYNNYVSTHQAGRKEAPSIATLKARSGKWRRQFGRYLPESKTARILDAGCGHGALLWWLQSEGYEAAEGVDVSPEQIAVGTSLGVKNLNLGMLEDFLNEKTKHYKVIFMRDVLEHIPKENVCSILSVCKKSLAPGGVVVIQVPNADSPFFGRIRYGDFTHENAYNKTSLMQLFNVAGLEPVDFESATLVPFGARTFFKWLAWKIVSNVYKLALKVEIGPGNYIVSLNIIAVARNNSVDEA